MESYLSWPPISDTQPMMGHVDNFNGTPDSDTQPMVTLIDNINGTLVSDRQPPPVRGRRKKSIVWDYFRVEKVDGNSERAFCNQCNKSFAFLTGSKLSGTSHLKRHITMGICPKGGRVGLEDNQFAACTPKSKSNGSHSATDRPRKCAKATRTGGATFIFDQERCNLDVAKMIIQHDYPLQMVEHSDSLARTLNSQYTPASVNTVQDHIVKIHSREKQNLINILAGIHGRVSLSLDLWTSDQTVGYAVLTGHFVDLDWKLQRRVLSIISLPVPDSEPALHGAVNACLKDWSLNSKLLAITLNQPYGIETIRSSLRSLLSVQKSDYPFCPNPIILGGQLITGSCYARVLSALAQDILGFGRQTIDKVRSSVKCVIVSELFHEKFREVKQQLQVRSVKTLINDDITSWKTTYEMLLAASELKEVFSCLEFLGASMPSVDEWMQVQTLCTYLKHLHDAASILTSKVYPTSNIFFNEVCRIYRELTNGSFSNDQFLSNLTKPLKDKFERYWYECFLILAVAAVMDPRYKLETVKIRLFMIPGVDVETWMKCVQDGVREMYTEYYQEGVRELCNEYCPQPPSPPPAQPSYPEEENGVIKLEMQADNGEFDYFCDPADFEQGLNIEPDDELDRYLNEQPLDFKAYEQDFDVLGWWRDNRASYPTLSKMASDILAIPLSSASPDSVFNNAEGKMDSLQSRLGPAMVEALLCTQDWLKYGSLDLDSIDSTTFVKMES